MAFDAANITRHPAQGWLAQLLAKVDALAAEMEAAGIDPRFARGAASALANFPHAPDYGLGGIEDRMFAAGVREAIGAYRAAQADEAA